MAGPDDSSSSAKMLFIVSSNVEKANPITRKLIRSHVMRGKKQKKGRPDKDRRTTNWASQTSPVKLEELIKTYAPQFPGRVGSDLSFIEFPDEIESSMLLNMTKSQ